MALEVVGLTVRYGALTAVADADVTVADGEVLALLGPSGCGKSTLLRAVAGLEPAAGTVSWNGADLGGVPVHRRGFGLVFQDGQLFPHRDVAGNVGFGMRMQGAPNRAERTSELLALVGLAGYERRQVTELSGGEQQRVALARALAPRPRLLLLDEPLSALDRVLREQLAMDLARVLRTTGTTALVVTHDHDEAFTLADRVAVMRGGRIVQVGAPAEVWRRPADEETARFLGCGQIVDATVTDGLARCALGSVTLPWAPEGRVRLGLRPTALSPSPAGVAGEVVHRVHHRDHTRLQVRLTHPANDAPPPGSIHHPPTDYVGDSADGAANDPTAGSVDRSANDSAAGSVGESVGGSASESANDSAAGSSDGSANDPAAGSADGPTNDPAAGPVDGPDNVSGDESGDEMVDSVVDAVAGMADAPDVGSTVHLALVRDGIAVLPAAPSRTGSPEISRRE